MKSHLRMHPHISAENNPGESRGVARIGVVVPFSNTNLEPDLTMLKPAGVSLHFARAGGYDLDQIPDSEQMREFALSSLEDVIFSLKAVRPDVILYGCTSATLAHGPQFDREFTAQIQSLAGCPAVTAAGALVEAINTRNVKRIAFSSPYVQKLNEEAIDFLAECDIQTVSHAYVGEDLGNYGQGELTPGQIYGLGLRANCPNAQALVLSCTDMRAVEAAQELEAALAKPVITSNQALMDAAVKILSFELRT